MFHLRIRLALAVLFIWMAVWGTNPIGDPSSCSAPIVGGDCRPLAITDVESFAARRELSALRSISSSDGEVALRATISLVWMLPPSEAVDFCRSFPTGSEKWVVAFYALRVNRHPSVDSYLLELAGDSSSMVRAHCYRMCILAHRNTLVEYAAADLSSNDVVLFVNDDAGIDGLPTLGKLANRYLRCCQNGRSEIR